MIHATKPAGSTEDFHIDFAPLLGADDPISAVEAASPSDGLTVVAASATGAVASVRLAGGVAPYATVTVRVTTASGAVREETLRLAIADLVCRAVVESDPDEKHFVCIDWTPLLGPQRDTIAASSWTAPEGVTVDEPAFLGLTTRIRLWPTSAQGDIRLVNTVTTGAGQTIPCALAIRRRSL